MESKKKRSVDACYGSVCVYVCMCVCVCVCVWHCCFLFIHVKGKKSKRKIHPPKHTRSLSRTHMHTWQYQQWIYATVSGCVCVNLDLLPWRLIGVLVQRENSLFHKVPVCLVLLETIFSNDVLQDRREVLWMKKKMLNPADRRPSKMVTPSLSFPCSWSWPLTLCGGLPFLTAWVMPQEDSVGLADAAPD